MTVIFLKKMEASPYNNCERGYLDMSVGGMFGGKSSRMMDVVTKLFDVYKDQKKFLIINSKRDTRNGGEISCHSSLSKKISDEIDYISLDKLSDLEEKINNYDIIGIDEGNMYPDIVETVKRWVRAGKYVCVAALTGNYKMEMFDNINMFDISGLLSFVDHIEHCKAFCDICKNHVFLREPNASFSKRIIQSSEECLIGNDEYIPTCRNCHSS